MAVLYGLCEKHLRLECLVFFDYNGNYLSAKLSASVS